MFRRNCVFILIIAAVLTGAGCHKNKAVNPIANIDSKQPDKVLFDRAMDALQHNKFDVARLTLQTLINTYPDSEYIARAKLAVGDSWYEEGGSTGLAQAELEYKDFITFFPNLPEAAEAQLKVAGIHYKQMEKPDRDFTHARRAEDEYRQLIQQFPDSKLLPEAKKRLMAVQEVLAEREYRIGRFYFLRESYPAAIARLKSLTDSYPLYSGSDEALFTLGQAYEGEMELARKRPFTETVKANLLTDFSNKAAVAYSRIIMRYPATDRVEDAKNRLKALNHPIPVPTPEALAQNKAEEASRGETGKVGRIMGNFRSRPDIARASAVGEPALEDPKPTSATDVVKDFTRAAGAGNVKVEGVKGTPKENDPAPRSDTPADNPNEKDKASTSQDDQQKTAVPLTKSQAQDAAAPPTQVNDAASSDSSSSSSTASSADKKDESKSTDDKKNESSSKKKKKKGLAKLNPF